MPASCHRTAPAVIAHLCAVRTFRPWITALVGLICDSFMGALLGLAGVEAASVAKAAVAALVREASGDDSASVVSVARVPAAAKAH